MLFIHFSAEESLQLSAHLSWCDFRSAEERSLKKNKTKSISLKGLGSCTLDFNDNIYLKNNNNNLNSMARTSCH